MTSELVEIIVRFNENTEVKLNDEVAKQLESIWDVLSASREFINSYNDIKRVLAAKRQLHRQETKMQAITDPQT